MIKYLLLPLILLFFLIKPDTSLHAQQPPLQLLPSDAALDPSEIEASPKEPWNEDIFTRVEEPTPWWRTALLWFPNRILDLVDVFRADVGVGIAWGANARITRYGQIGYREFSPGSLRIGDFGRRIPILLETSNEFGVGPAYVSSKDRDICTAEIGVGVDLLLGGYLGICPVEIFDFFGGIFLLDVRDDDLK